MSPPRKSEKLLLIGWDAADWKAINPLLDAGKMPNLARLVEGGTIGNLATLQPVLSPMLWTSIATGKRPYKHGVHGFSEPDPTTGGIRPVSNLSRTTKAMWNVLNQEGLHSVVVGWWPSHPAEPLTRGAMVSNHYHRATAPLGEPWPMQEGAVHPERWAGPLEKLRVHPGELTGDDLAPFLPGLEGMGQAELDEVAADPRVRSLGKIVADASSVHAAATALMQSEPWDFMAVYYDAIDHFGHSFMKYHPPRREHISERDFRIFNYCMEAGYIFHDMMLGALLALAGEDTTVLLMSDHGFHPDHLRPSAIPREPAGPAAEHRQLGILAARGPGVREDHRVYGAGLLDICPTVLHHFGLPVGEDMDGKVLLDIYREPAEVRRVPSWDEVDGDDGGHPPDRVVSPADSKAAPDQLVALGYIEEPDADRGKAVEQTVRELDYNLAQAYMDGGIYGEAAVLLERLYERWPLEHRFGLKLAGCYRATGRIGELRVLVRTVSERRLEEAAEARRELEALGLDDEARREAERERVEKMAPAERRQFHEGRRELHSKAQPNLFALQALEAQADLAEKRYGDALEKLAKLEEDHGARRRAITLRGEARLGLRDWGGAREAFREALEIDPEAPGPHLGLARAALAERDFETAAGHALDSVGLLFHQPRAHYLLGLAYYRAGDAENAERAFLIASQQAPLMAANYRMLAEVARLFKRDAGEAAMFRGLAREAFGKRRELSQQKLDDARAASGAPRRDGVEAPMPALLPRPEVLEGVPEEEIITVVSGLPRSGTSLMMQMLAAAGIDPYTDGARAADESNPEGYYEHDRVASLLHDDDLTWLREARGKAIKVVAPLLARLPQKLPAGEGRLHYRVLYMERPMGEILLSQGRMLDKLGKAPAGGAGADVGQAYLQQARNARATMVERGIPAMEVRYGELVAAPGGQAARVAEFLGRGGRAAELGRCVRPELYRSKGG